jgi:hypothetical protein
MARKKNLVDFALTEAKVNTPVVTYRGEIAWKDGMPYLVSAPVRLSEGPENLIPGLLRKCLDLPYDGQDPALQGLSNGEVISINLTRLAARGDLEALNILFNRILGQPKAKSESVVLTGSLNDFLDKVAEQTRVQTIDVPVETPEGVEDL